jgi:hypothetical protein
VPFCPKAGWVFCVVDAGAGSLPADWVLGGGAELELPDEAAELGGVDESDVAAACWTARCEAVGFRARGFARRRPTGDG